MTFKLTAEHLNYNIRGKSILSAVDLGLEDRECIAVVGPNGAGKTTLLRILAGLLEPSGGRLLGEDRPYGEVSRKQLARQIAYVPQSRPLRVPLTVEHLVLLGRYPYLSPFRMAPSQHDYEIVSRSLRLAGMEHLRERQLETLSGGERQSAYIAAALAQDSEILILDEPTAHLDPSHQRDIASLLLKLKLDQGMTILVATHDLNFASLIADRILALRQGAVVACGTPAELVRPDRLAEIFDAPFSVVRSGNRPVTLLEMDP